MPQPSDVISAEVILKSATGRSLSTTGAEITSVTVKDHLAAPETVAKAKRELEALGFRVDQGGVTLTIVGEAGQFERVFGLRLKSEKHPQTGQTLVQAEGDVVIPASLRDVVETVVFPEPPEFFP